jgi:hypothetical protein
MYFQVGLLVDDIYAAADEFERATGLSFEAPVERRLGDWTILVAFSLDGPPYVELIEGPEGSPWHAAGGRHLDHLGFWSADLEAERHRLDREGIAVAIDGARLGGQWLYHHLPHTGVRIEHIDESARAAFAQRRRDAQPTSVRASRGRRA